MYYLISTRFACSHKAIIDFCFFYWARSKSVQWDYDGFLVILHCVGCCSDACTNASLSMFASEMRLVFYILNHLQVIRLLFVLSEHSSRSQPEILIFNTNATIDLMIISEFLSNLFFCLQIDRYDKTIWILLVPHWFIYVIRFLVCVFFFLLFSRNNCVMFIQYCTIMKRLNYSSGFKWNWLLKRWTKHTRTHIKPSRMTR